MSMSRFRECLGSGFANIYLGNQRAVLGVAIIDMTPLSIMCFKLSPVYAFIYSHF